MYGSGSVELPPISFLICIYRLLIYRLLICIYRLKRKTLWQLHVAISKVHIFIYLFCTGVE